MTAIGGSSIQGVQVATDSLSVRANNLANLNTPGYRSLDPVVVERGGMPELRVRPSTPDAFTPSNGAPATASAYSAAAVGLATSPTATAVASSTAGSNVAGAPSAATSSAGPLNDVDLISNMVGLQQDYHLSTYNLAALRTQNRMSGELLDLLG